MKYGFDRFYGLVLTGTSTEKKHGQTASAGHNKNKNFYVDNIMILRQIIEIKFKLMKTPIAPASAILVVFFSAVLTGCENEESGDRTGRVFYDAGSKKNFSLDDQVQLNQLATLLANEPAEFRILNNAVVVDMEDSHGDFKAISVSYQIGQNVTKLVVPIREVVEEKNGLKYFVVEACRMKCMTTESCDTGMQEIIERCVSQTCTCTGGSGGSTSSIVFKD